MHYRLASSLESRSWIVEGFFVADDTVDNVLTIDVLRTELVLLAGCYVAWQIVLRKDRAIALETSVSDWKFALSGNRLPLLI